MSNEQRENVRGRINILALETTGPYASVALGCGGHDGSCAVKELSSDGKLTHLTSLVPLIDDILTGEGMKISDVNALAVSSGPGSFTGIRIGVSTARALAQALGIGIIKVPTLETFVYQTDEWQVVCPVFDARRSQIYAGAYLRKTEGEFVTLVGGDAWRPEDFLESLGGALAALGAGSGEETGPGASAKGGAGLGGVSPEIAFCGDGVRLYKDAISGWAEACGAKFTLSENPDKVQRASSVLKWAMFHGSSARFWEVEPIYMRKAEAQRKLDEKADLQREFGENTGVRPMAAAGEAAHRDGEGRGGL